MTTWIWPLPSQNSKSKVLQCSPKDTICHFDLLFTFNKHNYYTCRGIAGPFGRLILLKNLITKNYAQKHDLLFTFSSKQSSTKERRILYHFGMTTVRLLWKLAYLMKNYFPKRPPGAPLHTFSKLYDAPVDFGPSSFEAVYGFICGRRRVAVARYWMICLVLLW